MRLAILSDIHGNLTALDIALADLRAAGGADRLWFLGDYAALGPRPAECIQRLKALVTEWGEDNISFIRGNTDRYLVTGLRRPGKPAENAEDYGRMGQNAREWAALYGWMYDHMGFEEYEWLSKLRGEVDLEVPGYGWVVGYHGTPGDDEGLLTPDMPVTTADDALLDREGQLGIGGHIHVQMDRPLTTWRAVNVGSVGIAYDKPGHVEYGLFTFDGGEVHIDLRAIPYDVESVIADLAALDYPPQALETLARRLREGEK